MSHDRDFLDRTVERVVELDEWTHRATEFAGGWSEYERAPALTRCTSSSWEAYGAYEGEKARLEEQLRRMQQWEERGYGQGRKKKKTQGREEVDRRRASSGSARSTSRTSRGSSGSSSLRRLGAAMSSFGSSGAVVERGSFRLGPLDLELSWADRLAIVGANGSGKTTLLDAILGRLPLAAGHAPARPGCRAR